MPEVRWSHPLSRVKELFAEAIELAPAARDGFLAERCGSDNELRSAVLSLLDSHERATGFLDCDRTREPFVVPPPKIQADVGAYRIGEALGEGGFGTVYSAEQEHPVRRRVALKILKPGMDSRQILARFDAERQALSLMDHPNIARVLDAGTTADGRPYFVMELVRGAPITAYCDDRRLPTRQRLELFQQVCSAVHHAHQKGVIHRDIKPSNVLVAEQDGRPVPKVIDFGVAKAMQRPLTDLTLLTEIRQLIGTPEYMSPEQAAGDGVDIDTRSDVYSLGVLLYELLTGATPFDARELRKAALSEMQRMIREVDPPKPSTRLSRVDSVADVATRRGTEVTRLRSQIRGEVDWIVMKCLEKDRARRYESAAALAADVQNHLGGLPVAAGPPTKVYRLRKFVHRHKIGLAAAAMVFVALTAGLIATSLALRQAQTERDRAALARDQAQQHVRFIDDMFRSIHPDQAKGRQVTVREVLDAAAARVEGSFRDQPLSEAAVRETFGTAYAGIGLLDRAQEQLSHAAKLAESAGNESAMLVSLRSKLGDVDTSRGEFDQAEKTLRAALNDAVAQLGPADPVTLQVKDRLATLLQKVNRLQDALALRKELDAALTNPPPGLAHLRIAHGGNYGSLLHTMWQFDAAEARYREAMEGARTLFGEEHPDVIAIQMALATVARDRGDFKGSLQILESVLARARKVYGEDHPNSLITAHTTALLMSANARSADAEQLLIDTIARCRRVLGEDHPTTLHSRHDLVQIRMIHRRYDEAEPELREVIDGMRRVFGDDHRDTLMMRGDLARAYSAKGRFDAAAEIYRDIFKRLRATMGPDHDYTRSVQVRLAGTLCRLNRHEEAEPLLAEAWAIEQRVGQVQVDWSVESTYGACLERLGKYDQALPLLLEAERLLRAYPKLDRATMRMIAASLAVCYDRAGDRDSSEKYRQIEAEMAAPSTRPTTTTAGKIGGF